MPAQPKLTHREREIAALLARRYSNAQPPQASGIADLPDPAVDHFGYAMHYATEAVADGLVTAAEYEQAIFAVIQCMLGHGVRFEQVPEWDPTNSHLT